MVGSEQGRTRPVLVISDEETNQILPVVNVLPLTARKPGRRVYPNEVLLPAGTAGLEQESIVLCYQIRTLDKTRLQKRVGAIEDSAVQAGICDALCFELGVPLRACLKIVAADVRRL